MKNWQAGDTVWLVQGKWVNQMTIPIRIIEVKILNEDKTSFEQMFGVANIADTNEEYVVATKFLHESKQVAADSVYAMFDEAHQIMDGIDALQRELRMKLFEQETKFSQWLAS